MLEWIISDSIGQWQRTKALPLKNTCGTVGPSPTWWLRQSQSHRSCNPSTTHAADGLHWRMCGLNTEATTSAENICDLRNCLPLFVLFFSLWRKRLQGLKSCVRYCKTKCCSEPYSNTIAKPLQVVWNKLKLSISKHSHSCQIAGEQLDSAA